MLSLLPLLGASAKVWSLHQVIFPDDDNKTIYGRSVAISSKATNRIVVGASWENNGNLIQAGAIYVYDYNSNTGNYSQRYQKLYPGNVQNLITWNNTGSTIAISSDGTRIIAGAPYSNIYTLGTWYQQVGALVVFDLISDTWTQTGYIIPSDIEAYQGFGRSLAISSDGKRVASAYYNKPVVKEYINDQGKVFITYEKSDGSWAKTSMITPPTEWAGEQLKFGSDLHFADDSTLIIAVQLFNQSCMTRGTLVYKRQNENDWSLNQQILPITSISGKQLKAYGSHISMPTDSQSLLGVESSFSKTSDNILGSFVLLEKSGTTWSQTPQQTIAYEANKDMSGITFCTSDVFASVASDNDAQQVYIYSRGTDGKFVKSAVLSQSSNAPANLMFGSSFAWRSDCQVMVVGAMNKTPYVNESDPSSNKAFNMSHAYVFRIVDDSQPAHNSNVGLIVGLSLGGAILLVAVVVCVVFYLRKNKRLASPPLLTSRA